MGYFVAKEETLDPASLASLQQRKLRQLLDRGIAGNAFYERKLTGLTLAPESDLLARLPFTTRAEIQDDQVQDPPYGTNLSRDPSLYVRMHQTSGTTGRPIRWLDTPESWEWFKKCWCIVYRGAGLTHDDRILFAFSFGPFIGFWGAFEAATALGNVCLAAGGMSTAARLHYLFDNKATVLCCTPTYALRMADEASAMGLDPAASSIRLLILAGEPGANIASVRSRLETAWGARVIDHAGMTEIGAWGFECAEAPGGLHVIESEFIAEVVDPATGRLVSEGSLGELVLTNLGRWASPLIRYRTGDQVRVMRGPCACGRWFARCEGGVLGRVDDMLIIRGNNVFPSAVEAVVREFEEVAEFRWTVQESRAMTELYLEIEPSAKAPSAGLADRIASALRDRLHFRPNVSLVAPGSLPRFEMKARRFQRSSAP